MAKFLRLRNVLAATAFAAIAYGPASAQEEDFTNHPFLDNPVLYSQAFGLEMVALRLTLAEVFPAPIDINLLDEVVKLIANDYSRFAGTLDADNHDLNVQLFAALKEIADTATAGQPVTNLLGPARELLAQAYDIVIPPETQEDPVFKGAVMSMLLLADGGVAEGYEEGTVQPWEYPAGWVALQRVKEMWAEIAPLGLPGPVEDGVEMLDFLDTVLPQPEPPADITRGNPEEAEAPAQRLVGIIETITDANLYAGREPGVLAVRLAEETQLACEAYEDDNELLGDEKMYAIRGLFNDYLDGTLAFIDVDLRWRAVERFTGLIENFRDAGLTAAEALRGGADRAEVAEMVLRQTLILIYRVDQVAACEDLEDVLVETAAAFGEMVIERDNDGDDDDRAPAAPAAP